MILQNCILLTFFTPLLSFGVNILGNKILSKSRLCQITIFLWIFYFAGSVIIFYLFTIKKLQFHYVLFNWFAIGGFIVHWSVSIDSLVSSILLIIAIVSSAVHIYSLGYMSLDKAIHRFIACLSLFTFLMTVLVSADNLLQLFLGWEGVGACSYLLIGYHKNKISAASAAMKAFIVNRVSDFAFLIAIVIFYVTYKQLNFNFIFENIKYLSDKIIFSEEFFSISLLEIICFLLLLAAMGKSAQIGFHIWLPDAMEGPTPVSALIHSATMVTAGVFLIVKTSFLFEQTKYMTKIVLIIGCCTAVFGSVIAIAQNDIKKIIAYSTCSQLGYMFCSCGLAGYNIAIFHLMTHGFFKSMMFLCAGNVIHASKQQDIFKLGGMRNVLKKTHINFLFATLALSGIFPLSGFYSKDLILELAYSTNKEFSSICFYLLLFSTFLTSVYSFKIIISVFYGSKQNLEIKHKKIKEPGHLMQFPIYILLIGTLFSGPILFYILDVDSAYYFTNTIFSKEADLTHHVPQHIKILPMIVSSAGICIAIVIYKTKININIAKYFRIIFFVMKEKFFIDQFYNLVIVKTIKKLSYILHKVDIEVIDKFGPGYLSQLTKISSRNFAKIHTGYLIHYLIFIIASIITFSIIFIVKYKFLIS